MVLDDKEIYLLGASLKDLGKKVHGEFTEPWFAFTKLNGTLVQRIVNAVLEMEKQIEFKSIIIFPLFEKQKEK